MAWARLGQKEIKNRCRSIMGPALSTALPGDSESRREVMWGNGPEGHNDQFSHSELYDDSCGITKFDLNKTRYLQLDAHLLNFA